MSMAFQTVVLNRKGRKRKSAAIRHACGKIVQPTRGEATRKEIEVMQAIALAHPERQGLSPVQRISQLAGYSLGRLVLGGKLSLEQHEAARRFAIDARRFLAIYEAPSPNAPSLSLAGRMGGYPAPFTPEEIAVRRKTYNSAFNALSEAGTRRARCVSRVAVYDEPIPAGCAFNDLDVGLSTLVLHYGLTTKGKSGDFRN